ncbi:hypothetical protein ACYOEI_36065, partial [Singulisphaera rosea]
VAFSPDGRRLAAAGRQEVVIWDVSTGIRLLSLPLDAANRPTKSLMEFQSLERMTSSTGVWAVPVSFTRDGARLVLTGRKFHEREWQQGDDLPERTVIWDSVSTPDAGAAPALEPGR